MNLVEINNFANVSHCAQRVKTIVVTCQRKYDYDFQVVGDHEACAHTTGAYNIPIEKQ